MTVEDVITALVLPPDSRVDQRVPKKLLLEQGGAPTAADKKLIQEGIEELHWIAALKPINIGVPEFRDEAREYVEIAVLTVRLRPRASASRLSELIHRAIPYPLALIASQQAMLSFSLAHKRFSQGVAGRVIVDEEMETADLTWADAAVIEFLTSISISALPRQNLQALYQGLMDRVTALRAAHITGGFSLCETPATYEARRQALEDHGTLQREIASLRAQAGKEKQINRRVELNLAIQRLDARLGEALANL